jgi:WD40 repeat protein
MSSEVTLLYAKGDGTANQVSEGAISNVEEKADADTKSDTKSEDGKDSGGDPDLMKDNGAEEEVEQEDVEAPPSLAEEDFLAKAPPLKAFLSELFGSAADAGAQKEKGEGRPTLSKKETQQPTIDTPTCSIWAAVFKHGPACVSSRNAAMSEEDDEQGHPINGGGSAAAVVADMTRGRGGEEKKREKYGNWEPDASAKFCKMVFSEDGKQCKNPFSLVNRRHHCRQCGRVMCGRKTCLAPELKLVEYSDGSGGVKKKEKKVCTICFNQNADATDSAITLTGGVGDGVGVVAGAATALSSAGEHLETIGSVVGAAAAAASAVPLVGAALEGLSTVLKAGSIDERTRRKCREVAELLGRMEESAKDEKKSGCARYYEKLEGKRKELEIVVWRILGRSVARRAVLSFSDRDMLKIEALKTDIDRLITMATGDNVLKIAEQLKKQGKENEANHRITHASQQKLLELLEQQQRPQQHTGNKLRKVLAPLSTEFTGRMLELTKAFCPGTREWAFERVKAWRDEPNPPSRVFVITANKGIGKSCIAAMLTQVEKEFISGYFFCRHDQLNWRNPKRLIMTWAYQLSEKLPEYEKLLAELVEEQGYTKQSLLELRVQDLFTMLLVGPLHQLQSPPTKPVALLVDALDECEHRGRNELLGFIRRQWGELPQWLRLIATSRPSGGSDLVNDILKQLEKFKPIKLAADDALNMKDIEVFARQLLRGKIEDAGREEEAVALLVRKTGGVFLFLQYARETHLQDHNPQEMDGGESMTITMQTLEEMPEGLTELYKEEFERLEATLAQTTRRGEEQQTLKDTMQRCLEVVVAAQEPVPTSVMAEVLCCTKAVAKKVLGALALFFPERNGCVIVWHKSVRDWLIDEEREGEEYWVGESAGHRLLADACDGVVKEVKTRVAERRQALLKTAVRIPVLANELKLQQYTPPLPPDNRGGYSSYRTMTEKKTEEEEFEFDTESEEEVDSESEAYGGFALHRPPNLIRSASEGLTKLYKEQFERLEAAPVQTTRSGEERKLHRRLKEGKTKLAKLLDQHRQVAVHQLNQWERYCLRHVVLHLRQAKDEDTTARVSMLVCDLGYVESKAQAGQVFELAHEYQSDGTSNDDGNAQEERLHIRTPPYGTTTSILREHLGTGQTLEHQIPRRHDRALYNFYRFVLKHASLLNNRPHLTVQCAKNWPNGLLPAVQAERMDVGALGYLLMLPKQTDLGALLLTMAHGKVVRSVCFSSKGDRVLSGGEDGYVKVWDAVSGEEQMRMFHGKLGPPAVSGRITSVCFSVDDRRVLSGGKDGKVRVWATSGEEQMCMVHGGMVESVCFSPNGERVLSGAGKTQRNALSGVSGKTRVYALCASGTKFTSIKLWDALSGQEQVCMEHGAWVSSVCFSPDGRLLVSAGSDGNVKVWDAASGKEQACMVHGGMWVTSVCFSPKGDRVLSGGEDGYVKVWELSTESLHTTSSTIAICHGNKVTSVCFSSQSFACGSAELVLSGGKDGIVKVWGPILSKTRASAQARALKEPNREERARLMVHGRGAVGGVRCVCVSTRATQHGGFVEKRMASGGYDGNVKVWDPAHAEVPRASDGKAICQTVSELDGVQSDSAGSSLSRLVNGQQYEVSVVDGSTLLQLVRCSADGAVEAGCIDLGAAIHNAGFNSAGQIYVAFSSTSLLLEVRIPGWE